MSTVWTLQTELGKLLYFKWVELILMLHLKSNEQVTNLNLIFKNSRHQTEDVKPMFAKSHGRNLEDSKLIKNNNGTRTIMMRCSSIVCVLE